MQSGLNNLIRLESDNTDVNIDFPLRSASKPSERQTVAAYIFDGNPFLGSVDNDQVVLSNSTISLTYRDESGNYLGSDALGQQIVFYFSEFDYSQVFTNISSCAYYDESDNKWVNNTC